MIPAHLGVIPDGNRRFARLHGWSIEEGYVTGARTVGELVDWCLAAGVAHLSVFASSTENVARRPAGEVIAIFRALAGFCAAMRRRSSVALHVVGDVEELPDYVPGRQDLRRLQTCPAGQAALVVHLVTNYSGETDLVPLVASAADARRGAVAAEPLRHLGSANVPMVDLVVRTGGRRRLSGFLPHQCAYADLWFTETLWPAFTRREFDEALLWYARQDRHFGE